MHMHVYTFTFHVQRFRSAGDNNARNCLRSNSFMVISRVSNARKLSEHTQ